MKTLEGERADSLAALCFAAASSVLSVIIEPLNKILIIQIWSTMRGTLPWRIAHDCYSAVQLWGPLHLFEV
jgi:hypothetical protein